MDIFSIIRWGNYESFVTALVATDLKITDTQGATMLQCAIAFQKDTQAKDCIQHGVDVNHQDANGQTALHYCATYGNINIAEEILHRGGDVNRVDKHGNNALWTAVFYARGKYRMVELFLKWKGDPNNNNLANRSALDFAKQKGDRLLVTLLSQPSHTI
jgi:uncharacterized protein